VVAAAGSPAYGARLELPADAGTTGSGATRWPCPSSQEAIWYQMAGGVVSTRNCSAAAERGDGDFRSMAAATRVTHARVSTKEATIATPWAALSVPEAIE